MTNAKEKAPKIVLELKKITKTFPGTKALDQVDLRLYRGKVMVLMGENGAGKSTLLKTIFGIYQKDSGQVLLNGKEIRFKNPKEALNHGITMVHQELQQVLTTNVMDNIWLGRYPKIGPFVNRQKMIKDSQKIFDELNINIKPTAAIEKLSVSQRQMVEIAKAVSYQSQVLILDEPTSSLTEVEVKHLFSIIRKLKAKGVAILFVSHKMSEVWEIGDAITIFRDGKFINEKLLSQSSQHQIIKDMVGRELKAQFPPRHQNKHNREALLAIKNFASPYALVKNVNLKIKKGEIFGIAGLVGSGRTELAQMIFGMRTLTKESQLWFKGCERKFKNPKQAIKNGIVFLTEERKKDGIFPELNIEFNTTIGQINKYTYPWGTLNKNLLKIETQDQVEKLQTKIVSINQKINFLSGGNQQKVLVSRWLVCQPDLLIMDEPTRGIDVGAKYAIYQLINNLAASGKSVLIISSEMAELIGICNRIGVMSNGKLAGIINGNSATQEEIMTLAAKYY